MSIADTGPIPARSGPIRIPNPLVDTTGSSVAPEAPDAEPAAPSASTDVAQTADPAPRPSVAFDVDALTAADGDPSVFGAEMARVFTALTGQHMDSGSLTAIFGTYGAQVQSNAYRQAALTVANSQIESKGKARETIVALMDLRSDMAEVLLQTVSS